LLARGRSIAILCSPDGTEHDRDARPRPGDLGHGVLVGALTGTAHHQEIAPAERERERRASSGRPQKKLPGCPHGDRGDERVASVVGYGVFLGASVDGHAHVKAWLTAFQERPSYKAVMGG
jgi:hypothetical protein